MVGRLCIKEVRPVANLIRLAMQRGLGEAVRSWGGSAVLGVSPMSDCRGSPHEQLPWFPP